MTLQKRSTKRKRIAVLYCGGVPTPRRGGVRFRADRDVRTWLHSFPETQFLADVDGIFVHEGTTSPLTPTEWQELAATIHRRMNGYEGFVITHGLATLPYTAAALSFILQDLPLPVVGTGSVETLPGGTEPVDPFQRLGIRANLLNAIQLATLPVAGVLVAFGTRIIRGTQAVLATDDSMNMFHSYDGTYVGQVNFGVQLQYPPVRPNRPHRYVPGFDTAVEVITYHPGTTLRTFERLMTQGLHGMVIREDPTAAMPDSLLNALAKRSAALPIAIHRAGPSTRRTPAPLVDVSGMSPVTAIVKCMWALRQRKNPAQVRTLLRTNCSGEYATSGGRR